MRIKRENDNKPRKEKVYESDSLKDGKFTKDELSQYGLSDEEISTILEYQALLPILQGQDDNSTVNARDLHKQLNNGWKFTEWIENRVKSYDRDLCIQKDIAVHNGDPLYEPVRKYFMQQLEKVLFVE